MTELIESFFTDAFYSVFGQIILLIVLVLLINKIIKFFLNRFIDKMANTSSKTKMKFVGNTVDFLTFSVLIIGVIYSIPSLRSLAVGLFAGASIFAAFLGFASQKAFSDVISGVFIIIFKPFRVDDIVKINGEIGAVEDITLRHTVIKGLENKRHIYPNSWITSEPIINWTIVDPRVNKFMFISISYDSDIATAERIIIEEVMKHPSLLDFRNKQEKAEGVPLVKVEVLSFDNFVINFRVPLWAKDLPDGMGMMFDVQRAIQERFKEESSVELAKPSQKVYLTEDK
ncbi:mechanosensitive ion channel [Flammeovirgaceae bacterium SG7u.111]|nr:mechanosensitive ion channel [Flammeovirgaceae bacterium SG7u.132]WPO37850.1 mechanosensitive ion channel [Flammeovirgaceae bacterium SG7u.111]